MAVSTTNAFDGPFIANGVATTFPFSFTALTASDVSVTIDDQEVSGFSVSLNPAGGGSVTFDTAPAAGTLYILLDPSFQQLTAFEDGSGWLASPVNRVNDRGALRDQALRRDLQRTMRLPLGEGGIDLPAAADRKGKFLSFSPVDGAASLADAVTTDAQLRADLSVDSPGKGVEIVRGALGLASTRAVLAARPITLVNCWLFENGREGMFTWSGANLSAAVTADPAQAFYVPPANDATGASGAWVRDCVPYGQAYLTWFGNPGDGSASDAQAETAMTAAVAWINAAGNRVLWTAGTHVYTSDKVISANGARIEAIGPTRFLAKNSAKLRIGVAGGSVDGNGRWTKGGTKAIGVRIVQVGFLPNDGHSGSIVVLDYCDETTLDNVEISMYSSTSDVTGVECRWTQWVYLRRCKINVNHRAVWIRLQWSSIQNEDHYHFSDCLFYVGKLVTPPTSSVLMCIQVEKELANNYGIFEFSIRGCHFLGIPNDATRRVSALGIKSTASGDTRAIHRVSFYSCFFEDTYYAFDGQRAIGASDGYDTSRVSFDGCSFLRFGTVALGKDYSKNRVDFRGCYILQGTSITDGVQGYFLLDNIAESVTTPFVQGAARNRFSDKNLNQIALSGLSPPALLKTRGSFPVISGQTTQVVNHGLVSNPTTVDFTTRDAAAYSQVTANANADNLTSTTFRATFADPGANRTIYWEAEIDYQ